ncbi:MAG: RNA polymerase sigma factor [Actinomycetota bacterium]|nr:RNA polymerase sigma factor [Actinomycetota bacterium]
MTLPPFQVFVDEHAEAVHRFLVALVGPQEAEDALQETLIAALRAYPRLRPGSNLRAWGMAIARNKAIDSARARGRRPVPVEGAGEELVAPAAPAAELDGDLWGAVRSLPPKQRAAVALRYAGDLPHREVGEALGCSEEAARKSVAEGLKRLREVLA